MSLISYNDITLLSFVLSFGAIIVALTAMLWNRFHWSQAKSNDITIDVYAIVQEFGDRFKAFELQVIDLRVRLEILELRFSRSLGATTYGESDIRRSEMSLLPQRSPFPNQGTPLAVLNDKAMIEDDRKGVLFRKDTIRSDILRVIAENKGIMTAKEIQQEVGGTREHVARTVNLLYREGLLRRGGAVRPYQYSISEKGLRMRELTE